MKRPLGNTVPWAGDTVFTWLRPGAVPDNPLFCNLEIHFHTNKSTLIVKNPGKAGAGRSDHFRFSVGALKGNS
jgi:hypothetical protein